MILETERMYVFPLSCNEVGLLAEDKAGLETKLGLIYSGEPLVGHLLDVTKAQYEKIKIDEENYLWHTFWLFVLKENKTIIGSACFKGLPDANSAVEIGYGTNEKYRNKGYTTEAISTLCDWVFSESNIKNVIAETEKNNIPSQRVLEKNGFKVCKETDDCLWWMI